MHFGSVRELMLKAPVIPVIVIDQAEQAVPLAEALVAGGLPVLEVTLRTDAALQAIKAMSQVEGAIVGVGTALDASDLQRAHDNGARFAVSPGFTESLGKCAAELQLPLLPGVMTPADIMRAREHGCRQLKFFPAAQAGGPTAIKALGGPFHDIEFCPTGGISVATAKDYLALQNVLCIGGSWVASRDAISNGDWQGISERASACGQLLHGT